MGLIVPLAILIGAAVVIAAWLPELPAPVAVHWGTDGVDGYGPGWTYLVITLGLGGGLVLFLALTAMYAARSGACGTRRSSCSATTSTATTSPACCS